MMNYQEEIQRFLEDENLDFEEWISEYPITEAPALISEYKSYMQKIALENDDFDALRDLQELDDLAERIQDFTIDTLAAKEEKRIESELIQQKINRWIEMISKNGSEEIIVSDEFLDDIRQVIAYLKKQGIYDEAVFKPLQHLL
ncbi:hypothetical protein [Epilithonimonas sp.]|uniref:hypothetical protein n=1 Tax=Epilithonimonas sp. TaxID=2894511 RepID=UPI0035AE4E93